MDLLIASGNAGKVREFREMLGSDDFAWHDLSQLGHYTTVEETGGTFLENACLKATGYARQAQMCALADDSGLEVDALNGKPGIYSARWAAMNGNGAGDSDNNATLLAQLQNVPDEQRTARFVCVLALADSQGRIMLTAQGTLEGRILREPRGANGFGYDPLFYVAELGCTTAELSSEQKHVISHRGKALRQLRKKMDAIKLERGNASSEGTV